MKFYLEHANITVNDIDEAIKFLTTAFPDFKVRGKGESELDGVIRKWLHLGTDQTYVALEQISSEEEGTRRPYKDVGINHLGFVVEDIETIVSNLKKAGYKKSIDVEPHPFRKRYYFYDADGIEYEFIEYLSDKPEERNDYSL
jgi:catechol 2,3-dioxygenase-like lactoylglutathione lyase family enzyme